MKRRNPFLEAIANPTKNFITFFAIGVVLFTVIANGISELVWVTVSEWLLVQLQRGFPTWLGRAPLALAQAMVLFGLLTLLGVLVYATPLSQWIRDRLGRWLQSSSELTSSVKPLEEHCRGLIVAMSLKEEGSPAELAIYHHWNSGQKPHLEYCWILCTLQSQATAARLYQRLRVAGITEKVKVYYPSLTAQPTSDAETDTMPDLLITDELADDPNYVRRLIDRIYEHAYDQGLDDSEMIADFTGATKPIGTGIILGCADRKRRLSYLKQSSNLNNPGESNFIEVVIAYKLISKR